MFEGKRILGILAARGGSKRIPGKNLRDLGGRPLIIWSVEAARQARFLDRLVLSTEDGEIMACCRKAGCEVPFERPAEFATDTATSASVVRHALVSLEEEYDYVVLLQPTSPFRLGEDIDRGIALCVERRAPSVVSLSSLREKPAWIYRVDENDRLCPHEDAWRGDEGAWGVLNGAVYVMERRWFLENEAFIGQETLSFFMPPERSVDVDTEEDLLWARFLLSRKGHGSVVSPLSGV
ncbi:acylneuraminate cytidylyltransferase [Aminomonas paucivorans DSM 12260]|uniref:Acylneuraminate cytidylyltransferase n=2 Tax=Aminomonas TaxID=81411 RepID=E3CVX0_9BACT|nr:acylneuraminate cytidylyltransferase [Aminomonas paucivorans DSM 12260]